MAYVKMGFSTALPGPSPVQKYATKLKLCFRAVDGMGCPIFRQAHTWDIPMCNDFPTWVINQLLADQSIPNQVRRCYYKLKDRVAPQVNFLQ